MCPGSKFLGVPCYCDWDDETTIGDEYEMMYNQDLHRWIIRQGLLDFPGVCGLWTHVVNYANRTERAWRLDEPSYCHPDGIYYYEGGKKFDVLSHLFYVANPCVFSGPLEELMRKRWNWEHRKLEYSLPGLSDLLYDTFRVSTDLKNLSSFRKKNYYQKLYYRSTIKLTIAILLREEEKRFPEVAERIFKKLRKMGKKDADTISNYLIEVYENKKDEDVVTRKEVKNLIKDEMESIVDFYEKERKLKMKKRKIIRSSESD